MNTYLSCHDRVPIEAAIDIIEQSQLSPGDFVSLSDLHQEAERAPPPSGDDNKQLHWWLDHTLALLVNRGYLRRLHIGPGELGYTPTNAWHERNTVLKVLRPPKAKVRWARIQARQNRKAEREAVRQDQKTATKRSNGRTTTTA